MDKINSDGFLASSINNVHNCSMFSAKHAGMSLMSLTWGKAPPPNPAALHH